MISRHAVLVAIALTLLAATPRQGSARPDPKAPETKAPAAKPGAAASNKLDWLQFDAAAALAAKQNKHMIVDVYTTWCGWCKVMDRQTYGDPEVAGYLTKNFVLAKVNGESASKVIWKGKEMTERQFAREVGVTGYPATFFMKPNAELLGGVPGYIKSPDFMIYSRYVATKWYEKGKIQEYVDSLRAAAP
jgi:thioredoxin-related protein